MEQDFQTSFIPKKPVIEERSTDSRPIGFLTVVAIFIFFAVALGSGGLYFYKVVLTNKITKMESDLHLAQNRFEPSKILQLQTLDKRLRASNEILSRHLAISPVFETLEALTMKTVRYTKFTYSLGSEKNDKLVAVKMSGQAIGYRSIALQSDIFTKNKYLIDPVFSNLSLDNSGNVLFDLDFSVDPSFVDYAQVLKTRGDNTVSISPEANETANN